MKSKDLLKPEIIERVTSLNLRARIVVEGFLVGLHQSPFHGFSLEFHEHRPYYPGDPINRIDWKLYARTDRYYLKKYSAETNLSAYILMDKSNSMNYGKSLSKFNYSRTIAASLIYLLIHQNDSAGLVLYNNDIDTFIPPKSRLTHLNTLLNSIANSEPSGKTELSNIIFKLAPKIKKRSLIIIFSDLLEDPESIIKAVRLIKVRKNEVIVFQVLDKDEINFDMKKQALYRDMENNITLPVNPPSINHIYRRKFNQFMRKYREGFASNSIDYSLITTDTPYNVALSSYLQKRKRLL